MSSTSSTQVLSAVDYAESSSGAPPVEGDDLIGAKLNNYVVERVLGEGGMGRVYLARHTRISQKYVAIKVLHREFASNSQMTARFRREAEAAFAVSHPNVVTVLDIDSTPSGLPYLVCEYLEGVDLSEHLDAVGKLHFTDALHVAHQVCQGVAAAHARGVIHRDLKPANVFLVGTVAKGAPERLCAKVLDFGLSRFLEPTENDQLTKTGLIMGTPGYMAPEQARGQRVDHRADIYGAGAILYATLTGRAPFEGESAQATLLAVMESEPTRPRSLEPSIPAEVELVIERAMAKDPAQRYPDMLAFEEAIEAVFHGAVSGAGEVAAPRVALPSRVWPEAEADDVRSARPRLVLSLLAAVGLFVFAATAAIRGVEFASGHVFTTLELRLCLLAIVGSSLTPALVWLTRLRRKVWDNSSRVLVLLGQVRAAVIAFIVTYGVGTLVLHLVDDFLARAVGGGVIRPIGANWPGWNLLIPGMSVVAAWGAAMRRRLMTNMNAGWRRALAVGSIGALVLAALVSIGYLGIRWHERTSTAGKAALISDY